MFYFMRTNYPTLLVLVTKFVVKNISEGNSMRITIDFSNQINASTEGASVPHKNKFIRFLIYRA
jgi:hypothetical protein